MRSLDVSAFDPVGVNQNKLRFLEAFAAFCVLEREPADRVVGAGASSMATTRSSRARAASRVCCSAATGATCRLRDWALEIVDSMRGVCELLDEGDAQRPYTAALEAQEAKVRDVSLTPAARTLLEMRTNEESFFDFALRMSQLHKSYFLELYSPNESRQHEFAAEADESLQAQARIEADGQDRASTSICARYFAAECARNRARTSAGESRRILTRDQVVLIHLPVTLGG